MEWNKPGVHTSDVIGCGKVNLSSVERGRPKMMEGHYSFRPSSGQHSGAPAPYSNPTVEQQTSKDDFSHPEDKAAEGRNSPKKRRLRFPCKRFLVCSGAVVAGVAALLLKLTQFVADPELSFSENLYMILHIVNDVLLAPPYDAWTLEDMGAAREYMNRLLSTALMKEEQPISFKFTWRLRPQPLDETFFSPRPLCSCTQALSLEEPAETVFSFGKDSAGEVPSSLHCASSGHNQRRKTLSSASSCLSSSRTACNNKKKDENVSCSSTSDADDAPRSSHRYNVSTKQNRVVCSASSSSSSPPSSKKETFHREDGTSSSLWEELPDDIKRIEVDIYSGDYELLPPSDEASVQFLTSPPIQKAPLPQQQQGTCQQQQQQQQKGRNIWQQLQEKTHWDKAPQQDTNVNKRQREHQQARRKTQQQTTPQQREVEQQQQQQQIFPGRSLPSINVFYFTEWVQRLFSAVGERLFNTSQTVERKPKRQRLLPPFPNGRPEEEEEDEDDLEQQRKQESACCAESFENEAGEKPEVQREADRGKARKQKEGQGREKDEGGETQGDERELKNKEKKKHEEEGKNSNGQSRLAKEGESVSIEKAEKEKKKRSSRNIFSSPVGYEVYSGKTSRPVFEVTAYWTALSDSSEEEKGGETAREWQEDDIQEKMSKDKERGETHLQQRKGSEFTGERTRKLKREEEEQEEESNRREGLRKDKKIEETLQLVQQLKEVFLVCSAEDEVSAERRKAMESFEREYEIERRWDRVGEADRGKKRRETQKQEEAEEQEEADEREGRMKTSKKSIEITYSSREMVERDREREEERDSDKEGEKEKDSESPSKQQEKTARQKRSSKKAQTCAENKRTSCEEGERGKQNGSSMQQKHTHENKEKKTKDERKKKRRQSSMNNKQSALKEERKQKTEIESDRTTEVQGTDEEQREEEEEEGEAVDPVASIELKHRKAEDVDDEKVTGRLFKEMESASFEFLAPELRKALELRENRERQEQERKTRLQETKTFWSVLSSMHSCRKGEHPSDERKQAKVPFTLATGILADVAVSRLAPEYKFPLQIQDSLQAISFVLQHGDALNIDPTRLALLGDSGGGNLAAAVMGEALRRVHMFPWVKNIKALVLVYPSLCRGCPTLSQIRCEIAYLALSTALLSLVSV